MTMTKPKILTKFDIIEERVSSVILDVSNHNPKGKGAVHLLIEFEIINNNENNGLIVEKGNTFTVKSTSELIALNKTKEAAEDLDVHDKDHQVLSLNSEMDFIGMAREEIQLDEIENELWFLETLLRPVVINHLRRFLDFSPLTNLPPYVYLKQADD